MGADRYRSTEVNGTSFRVWAPFADSVHLAGSFNGWSDTAMPMVAEGNGNWSLDVRNVKHGARYQYVIRNGGNTLWRNDPRARQVTSSVGDSIVIDPEAYAWSGGSFSTPAWNEMVVYEMHIGTFNDPAAGGAVGTFQQAEQRLDDLADLGINVIQLMPIAEFAGDYSWGYNYGHPFAVESAYGGAEALKSFVDAAHARGIAVTTDVVNNHWGPTDMDLWQFDGWSAGPGYGGIYFYNDARSQTPWGDTRPDYGRNEVRQYIRDNALYWLEEYRLDGLRWDSTSYMRRGPTGDIPEAWSLMQWANDEIDARMPWKISIAEDMWSNPWITQSSGAGGAGFDAQWDPNFVHPIRGALIPSNDADRDMGAVSNAIGYRYNGDAFQRLLYTESHDENANGRSRLPEEIWPGNADSWYSKKRSTLGAALVMTSPGIPMLFQGQEFLEDGYFSDSDPLDWSKRTTFAGIRRLYRDLIRLRRNWWNETRGLRGQQLHIHHVNHNDKMVAFHRWDQGGPGDDVIVIANFSSQAWTNYRIGLPRTGTWKVRFNSDSALYDASFGGHPSVDVVADPNIPWDGMAASAAISIGPYTAVILSQ
ncbi:MAG: 1,4-alpha-glucan branching protein [Planctomycetes bacterium]|nr:1,4-alpha-glucan branching protein [Planctomycetota bacterium]